jgi:hypothetical protein
MSIHEAEGGQGHEDNEKSDVEVLHRKEATGFVLGGIFGIGIRRI